MEKKLIYSIEKGGLLDEWTEEIYCTKLKDGSFTLQEFQVLWDDETRRTRRIKLKSVKGIRTPKKFANELKNLEKFDYTETSDEGFKKIEKNLISLDNNFFKGLKDLIEEIYDEEDEEENKKWERIFKMRSEKHRYLEEERKKQFNIRIKNKDYEGAFGFLGYTSFGFLKENREAVIKSLELNYENKNPKDLTDVSGIEFFIQNFDEKILFDNKKISDYEKELIKIIKNSPCRLAFEEI